MTTSESMSWTELQNFRDTYCPKCINRRGPENASASMLRCSLIKGMNVEYAIRHHICDYQEEGSPEK